MDTSVTSPPPRRGFKRLLHACALPMAVFGVVYLTHVASGVIASGDSRWYVPAALSLINEGNLDLDEYPEMLEEQEYYWVERVNGHFYTRFPMGMALLSAPFVYVLDRGSAALFGVCPAAETFLLNHCSKPVDHATVITMYWRVELLIACFLIALATVFVYLAAVERLTPPRALLIAFLFAFCTSAWSVGSRSLGQHGGSMLMLAITLYLLVLADRKPWAVQFAGLPLAFSFVVRPTNGVPILLLTVYVLIKHRRHFLPYLGWPIIIMLLFLWYNFTVYHTVFSPYYLPQKQLGRDMHFLEALAGTMISPNRGLIIFTPIVLLSFAALALPARDRLLNALLATVILLHWLVISTFGDWGGGHSYGPRYFSDLGPFLVWMLVPLVAHLTRPWTLPKTILAVCLALFAAIGFFTHSQGATRLATHAWNREPVDVSDAPDRLWDWSDWQCTRGLGKHDSAEAVGE